MCCALPNELPEQLADRGPNGVIPTLTSHPYIWKFHVGVQLCLTVHGVCCALPNELPEQLADRGPNGVILTLTSYPYIWKFHVGVQLCLTVHGVCVVHYPMSYRNSSQIGAQME